MIILIFSKICMNKIKFEINANKSWINLLVYIYKFLNNLLVMIVYFIFSFVSLLRK